MKMERELSVSGPCFQHQQSIAGDHSGVDNLPQECRFSWYWNRKDIETYSPSRKDGIDLRKESQLRMLYCSFLQDIGKRLGVPQFTIATAIMFCHRFYLHQSHAKNEWQDEQLHIFQDLVLSSAVLGSKRLYSNLLKSVPFKIRSQFSLYLPTLEDGRILPYERLDMHIETIATVCMFLASKVEDTPRYLDKVVRVAYDTMYQKDPVAAQRIHQKDVFEKQKALILTGEKLLLCTIRFDFNIQHPYRPLHEAFRKLQIAQMDVRQTAWSFVNDWLRTTLCLQFKPNYIAAGSLYLAAKHHNVKLPSGSGCVWWQVLDIVPHQLDAVVQQMMELLGYKRRPVVTPPPEKPKPLQSPIAAVAKEEASSSPDSCVMSGDRSSKRSPSCDLNEEASRVRPMDTNYQSSSKQNPEKGQCELRDPESPNGVVEDCPEISRGIEQARTEPDQGEHALNKINLDRIKALMNMRKRSRENCKWTKASDESGEDAWIERELEAGIELSAGYSGKRQKPL